MPRMEANEAADFESAPVYTIFSGTTHVSKLADDQWAVFDLDSCDTGLDNDEVVAHLDEIGVDALLQEPELCDEETQGLGFKDTDAALAFLASGGTLCKVPDAPDSPYCRYLVVDPEGRCG